jgi:hypothetical protein
MKTFRIIETRPATAYWEYVVEAETEEQALEKVFSSQIEADDFGYEMDEDDDGNVESDFEVWGDVSQND